jgi:hypothetical protein
MRSVEKPFTSASLAVKGAAVLARADAMPRDGKVIVLFGPRPDLIGWQVVEAGRPDPDSLARVRHLTA